MDFSDLEIQIDYAIGRTINEELNAVFSTLKSSTPNSFDIFNMMGYFEFQNPSSDCGLLGISLAQLKNCCKSDDWVYDLLRDFTEDRLAVLPGTMRKFVYAPSNRINFCNWDYNMFTKRNLYTDLTPGSYPVTIKYYKPNSTSPYQSFNQTFIKNQ